MADRGASAARWRGALVWASVALCLGWFVHFWATTQTANETVRLFFVRAVVDHGTAALDPVMAEVGYGVADAVPYEGRWYMDKAPGLPLAVAPVYWVLTRIAGFGTDPHDLPALAWLLLLFGVLLPALLGAVAVERLVGDWTGGDRSAARLAAVGLALATPYGIYAGLFFGHAPAAALGAAALLAAWRGRFAWCGVAGGAMVLVDTATAPWAALLGLFGAAAHRRPRAVLACAAGGAPFVAAQLAYNALLFGDPFTFAYAFKAIPEFVAIHGQGLYGFGLPTLQSLGGLLLSPSRGLFFFAPALLFGVWGLAGDPRGRWLLAAVGLYAAWIAGFGTWQAGECYGPRHLLPATPALAAGLGLAAPRLRTAAGQTALRAALAWGLGTTWLVAATWPYAPEAFVHPLANLAWPLLRHGHVSPSVGTWLGLPASASTLLPLVVGAATLVLCCPPRRAWLPASLAALALALGLYAATPPASADAEHLHARIICLMGDRAAGAAHCRAHDGQSPPGPCRCLPARLE